MSRINATLHIPDKRLIRWDTSAAITRIAGRRLDGRAKRFFYLVYFVGIRSVSERTQGVLVSLSLIVFVIGIMNALSSV